MLFFFANGVIAHVGYEFYPRQIRSLPGVKWLNTATFHNLHHHAEPCNYGTATTVWDHWMGTDHPAYAAAFAAIKARHARSSIVLRSDVSTEVVQGATGPAA
jgi:sterol desaturase/sphingolipid hydroxylase (fatty acid hydroxylase superfamily)